MHSIQSSCYRTRRYTVCRHIPASFSLDILQVGAVKASETLKTHIHTHTHTRITININRSLYFISVLFFIHNYCRQHSDPVYKFIMHHQNTFAHKDYVSGEEWKEETNKGVGMLGEKQGVEVHICASVSNTSALSASTITFQCHCPVWSNCCSTRSISQSRTIPWSSHLLSEEETSTLARKHIWIVEAKLWWTAQNLCPMNHLLIEAGLQTWHCLTKHLRTYRGFTVSEYLENFHSKWIIRRWEGGTQVGALGLLVLLSM